MKALFLLGFLACVSLLLYSGYSSYQQSQRRAAIWSSCAPTIRLHVIVDAELGQTRQAARAVAMLLDAATCPPQIRVLLLEHVSSIKAFDDMGPALQSESRMAPRYGTWFQEQIAVKKVHQSRNLKGLHAILHLLEGIQDDEAWIVWWPPALEAREGWDIALLHDLAACTQRSVLTAPAVDRFASAPSIFGAALEPAFFVLDSSLSFKPQPLARPSLCPSIGLSLHYPFAAQAGPLRLLAQEAVAQNIENEDLSLSLIADMQHLQILHGSSALFSTPAKTRLINRRHQAYVLSSLLDADNPKGAEWLWKMALGRDEEDFQIYARALLGLTEGASLSEIMAKYGSQEALETEKEALKYG